MDKEYKYTLSSVEAQPMEYNFYSSSGESDEWSGEYTTSDNSLGDNSDGTVWINPYQPSTTVPYIQHTWAPATTTTWTYTDMIEEDRYPKLPNALGVIYVEEGVIKCRTPEGEDIILGEMEDGDEEVSIKIIATIAKRLLQKEEKAV